MVEEHSEGQFKYNVMLKNIYLAWQKHELLLAREYGKRLIQVWLNNKAYNMAEAL